MPKYETGTDDSQSDGVVCTDCGEPFVDHDGLATGYQVCPGEETPGYIDFRTE